MLEEDLKKKVTEREYQGAEGLESLREALGVGSLQSVWSQLWQEELSNGQSVRENFDWPKEPKMSSESKAEGLRLLEEDLKKKVTEREYQGAEGLEALREALGVGSLQNVWLQLWQEVLSNGQSVRENFDWPKQPKMSSGSKAEGLRLLEEDLGREVTEREYQGAEGLEALREALGVGSLQNVWLQLWQEVLSNGQSIRENFDWPKAPKMSSGSKAEGLRLLEEDLKKKVTEREYQGAEGLEALREALGVGSLQSVWLQLWQEVLSNGQSVREAFNWPSSYSLVKNRSEVREAPRVRLDVSDITHQIGRKVLEEVSRLSYRELRSIFTDEEMTALVAWGIAYAEDSRTALRKVSGIEAGLKSLKQGQTAQVIRAFEAARLLKPSPKLGAVLAQTYRMPTKAQLLFETLKLRSQTGQLLHIVVIGDESEQAKLDALLESLQALKDIHGQAIENRLRVSVSSEENLKDYLMEVSSELYAQARLLEGVPEVIARDFFRDHFVQLYVGQDPFAVRALAEKWGVQNSIGIGLAIEKNEGDAEALENAGYLLAMKRSQATKLKKAVERMLIKEDYRFYQTQVGLLRGWAQTLTQEMDVAFLALAAA